MFWNRLSIQPTWIVFFFRCLLEVIQTSVQENEIDICQEILKDVDNIIDEFPDAPEFSFPADTSVQPDLNPNPINQSIFLAGISVQPDLNPDPINQGPADVSNDNSIGTSSNNLSCFASV